MRFNTRKSAAIMIIALSLAVVAIAALMMAASGSNSKTLWGTVLNKGVNYGIIENRSSAQVDLSRLVNAQSVLPWPVITTVTPNPAHSGQKMVKFDIAFEYPFPGTTANIADTVPTGYVITGPYTLDGKTITPTTKTDSKVTFNKVPSPSAISPTGVRHIVFYATAPKITKTITGINTATAQFYSGGLPYGPLFYYKLTVTTVP